MIVRYAACVISLSLLALFPRRGAGQQNGATSASTFMRRAYHSSLVAGKYVYIDGGEFSTKAYDVDFSFSSTLLSIDLSQDWTNDTVTLHSTTKPSDVPSLVGGGLWYDDDKDLLYTGFAGRVSIFDTSQWTDMEPYPMGIWTFKPDGTGSGTWGTAIESNASVFDNDTDSYITRPYIAAVAHGAGAGYVLGGAKTYQTAPGAVDGEQIVPLSGMLKFNMSTQTLTNVTVDGPRFHGVSQYASMLYVPYFGSEGVFVVLGGNQLNETGSDRLLDWGVVSVFDPVSGKWWDQETTGNRPENRKEFCSTGLPSDNGTYEIFVYAGWSGSLGTGSNQYDEIFILTLPAFHWIKVDYNPYRTRHGLTCHHVGGGQILVIGGLDTQSNDSGATIYETPFRGKDNFTQGLAVYDLNTLQWQDKYKAEPPAYTQPDMVRNYYKRSDDVNAEFNSTDLKSVFSKTSFPTTTNNTSRISSASASSTATDVPQTLGPGALAGTIVGAIALMTLFLAALISYCCIKRRRQRQISALDEQAHTLAHSPSIGATVTPPEMDPTSVGELHAPQWRFEMAGMPPHHQAHEKDGQSGLVEMPANEAAYYELPADSIAAVGEQQQRPEAAKRNPGPRGSYG
ncbi:uncharacterized protein K452DRAFT_50805 [Aplosporella prunicola CBS 121167]|uniref:Galactose oxidase n=1 Tax=Aplosporella prunicola CBS 121167 TaxID=1176127 RepID=A0A6A6B970_9PEZI|nr:uncharacterized protein K452DRAFT_50805 [Aplosporella prunicola CBS 121167]KAF2140749.1 hypothetical protein K452DRAFT_50805 [Aplosporella prunicola CBS 121167]